jgi:hypothetical protein
MANLFRRITHHLERIILNRDSDLAYTRSIMLCSLQEQPQTPNPPALE